MPKSKEDATASEPRLKLAIFFVVVFVGICFGLLMRQSRHSAVKLGSTTISLERAITQQQQARGLSGRDNLGQNNGMLFVFTAPGKHCFWMKDTKLPLDIIWLSSSRQVIHIEQDVSPGSYPQTFCPDSDALYVIEVNAGTVQSAGSKLGDTLNF